MDKETLQEIDNIVIRAVDKAYTVAVAKMREFHLNDLKVLGERIDLGFEGNERRFNTLEMRMDGLETRMDRVENALQILINEMREDRNELKRQISELTLRV